MLATPSPSVRPRPRWWQFSLLNLLLFALSICVGAAFYGSKQQVKQIQQARDVERQKGLDQEAEIKKFRTKLGILDVKDESKIHIQARRDPLTSSPEALSWRWRIHLPRLRPGESWGFHYQTGTMREGDAEMKYENSSGWGTAMSGQFDLTIALARDINGTPWFRLEAIGDRRRLDGDVRLSEAEVTSLSNRVRSLVICDAGNTSADKRLEILRIPSGENPGEEIGLVVFLQKNLAKRHPETGALIP